MNLPPLAAIRAFEATRELDSVRQRYRQSRDMLMKRLPQLGRSLGGGMREFKDSVTGKDDDDDKAGEVIEGPKADNVTTATADEETEPARRPQRDPRLKPIGRNLKAERVRMGLKQEDVANATGLVTAQVARMERGEVNAGLTKWIDVAHAVGVDVATLLRGVE